MGWSMGGPTMLSYWKQFHANSHLLSAARLARNRLIIPYLIIKIIPTALPYGLALGMIFILALGLCMRFLKLFFNFFIKFFPA